MRNLKQPLRCRKKKKKLKIGSGWSHFLVQGCQEMLTYFAAGHTFTMCEKVTNIKRNKISVLGIRDPVPFWPLDPGWKNSDGLKILKFFDADPGSGIFLSLDPGWKNLDPGSGINIPDPKHCKNYNHFRSIHQDYTVRLIFVSFSFR